MASPLAHILVIGTLALPGSAAGETVNVCNEETELMDFTAVGGNGRDRLELAVICGPAGPATIGGHVELWEITGTDAPHFEKIGQLDDVANPDRATKGDMDGDGDFDLIVVNQGQHKRTVRIFRNDGDGTFAPVPHVFDRGGAPTGDVSVHDANADGAMDILIGRGATPQGATVLINAGEGAIGPFRQQALIPEKSVNPGIQADMTGDTFPGMAVPLPRHGRIRLFFGHSDDQAEMTLGKAARSVESVMAGGDTDGNGIPEILVTTRKDATTVETRLAISEDGEDWAMSDPIPNADDPVFAFFASVDADPEKEMLIVTGSDLRNRDFLVRAYDWSKKGIFGAGMLDLGAYPYSLMIAPVQGDERAEILVGDMPRNEIRVIGWD
ncbi:MAG: FG-GAP repeat domain-containing protein [Paracoccaceae bacterium]